MYLDLLAWLACGICRYVPSSYYRSTYVACTHLIVFSEGQDALKPMLIRWITSVAFVWRMRLKRKGRINCSWLCQWQTRSVILPHWFAWLPDCYSGSRTRKYTHAWKCALILVLPQKWCLGKDKLTNKHRLHKKWKYMRDISNVKIKWELVVGG